MDFLPRSAAHHHEPRAHGSVPSAFNHGLRVTPFASRALSRRSLILAGILVLAGAVVGCTDTGQPEDFFGVWDVNTILTAGSDPVNPSYKEGDLRIDVWTIAGTLEKATLTGNQGTVPGRTTGTVAAFEIAANTGLGIIAKGKFDLYLTSSASLKGTITADYFSAQFGYKVGLDAWTAEAVKCA